MRISCICCVTLALSVALSGVGASCAAQEVGFVDLTKVTARTELRPPQPTRESNKARGGITQDQACDFIKNEGELRTTLVSLNRTHYQDGDEPKFEVTVENVASAPIRIPFSPHLADLQPENPAQKFAYSELRLALWIAAGTAWSATTCCGNGMVLYGAEDHAGTMLTLNPAESVRIIGKGKFLLPDDLMIADLIRSGHDVDHAYAQSSLYRVQTLLTPKAAATTGREVCLSQTSGGSVPIALTGSKQ